MAGTIDEKLVAVDLDRALSADKPLDEILKAAKKGLPVQLVERKLGIKLDQVLESPISLFSPGRDHTNAINFDAICEMVDHLLHDEEFLAAAREDTIAANASLLTFKDFKIPLNSMYDASLFLAALVLIYGNPQNFTVFNSEKGYDIAKVTESYFKKKIDFHTVKRFADELFVSRSLFPSMFPDYERRDCDVWLDSVYNRAAYRRNRPVYAKVATHLSTFMTVLANLHRRVADYLATKYMLNPGAEGRLIVTNANTTS